MKLLATDTLSEEVHRLLSESHAETSMDVARLLAMIDEAARNGLQGLSLVTRGQHGELYMARAGRIRAFLTVDADAPNELLLLSIHEGGDAGDSGDRNLLEALIRMQKS